MAVAEGGIMPSSKIPPFLRVVDGLSQALVHQSINSLEGTTPANISGGGAIGQENAVGSTTLSPLTFSADTGYIEGSATYAAICGGYDHVNNQAFGTVLGGGHHFLKYDATGCSVHCGGSYTQSDSAYFVFGSGRTNTVTNSDYSCIGGSQLHVLTNAPHTTLFGGNTHVIANGSHNTLMGGFGFNSTVTPNYFFVGGGFNHGVADSDNATIVGGSDHGITGVADGATIFGGQDCAASANWVTTMGGYNLTASGARYQAFLGGYNNDGSTAAPIYASYAGRENVNTSGIYSFVSGWGNTSLGRGTLTHGKDARHVATNGLTLSSGSLNEDWDNQDSWTSEGVTSLTLTAVSTNLLSLSAGKPFFCNLRVRVVGMQDGSADANNNGIYAIDVWEADIGVNWDGTNLFLFTDSASDGPGVSAEITLPRRGAGSLTFTPAFVKVSGFGGILRTYIGGKSNTVCRWVSAYKVLGTVIN